MATSGGILKFQVNIPQVIAFAQADGKVVEGDYGTDVLRTVLDGEGTEYRAYFPMLVEQRFQSMGIQPGEPIKVCKAEVVVGRRKTIHWQIERVGENQGVDQVAAPARPAPSKPPVQHTSTPDNRSTQIPPMPQPAPAAAPRLKVPMEKATIAAIRIMQNAMKSTGEQWSDQARQDLVSTILITAQRENWLAIWSKELEA